jgi:hypothetical protein
MGWKQVLKRNRDMFTKSKTRVAEIPKKLVPVDLAQIINKIKKLLHTHLLF